MQITDKFKKKYLTSGLKKEKANKPNNKRTLFSYSQRIKQNRGETTKNPNNQNMMFNTIY